MICSCNMYLFLFFFFNDTATTEIYTLSLHDALPICGAAPAAPGRWCAAWSCVQPSSRRPGAATWLPGTRDRKSIRLNSSHGYISYAVFCLKKKKNDTQEHIDQLNLNYYMYKGQL